MHRPGPENLQVLVVTTWGSTGGTVRPWPRVPYPRPGNLHGLFLGPAFPRLFHSCCNQMLPSSVPRPPGPGSRPHAETGDDSYSGVEIGTDPHAMEEFSRIPDLSSELKREREKGIDGKRRFNKHSMSVSIDPQTYLCQRSSCPSVRWAPSRSSSCGNTAPSPSVLCSTAATRSS